MLFQTKEILSEHWKQCSKSNLPRHNIKYQSLGKQAAKATDKFQLTAPVKSSSSIQISKQQTEMLPIQIDSVQGSVDIAENETMEISDVTESNEYQTDRLQLIAPMKSSSNIQISKQQTEMLPIQIDSVQGSTDIAEIESMEISDITESHENQRNSSSNLEKLVQSRKKPSEVIGQAEAEATLFSSEKYQTIDLSRSSSPASQRSRSGSRESSIV